MKKKMSIEYDPDDIPKLRDIVKVQFMEIQDRAYQQGTDAERERIIKLLETEMAGRDSWLTAIQLIKGEL
jgi:hypothetical protein